MNLTLPAKRYVQPALEELSAAAKPYRLISKTTGIKLAEYKKNTLNLIPFDNYPAPEKITVDEVVVQSTKNPQIKKTITTFRDYSGNIKERITDNTTPGSKLRNRLYKKDCCNMRDEDKFFTKRVVQEYTIPKNRINDYKQRLNIADSAQLKDIYWNQESSTTNILEINHEKLQKLLTTIKTVFTDKKNIHSIKESAPIKAVNGKMKIAKNAQTKFLEIVTSQKANGEITIESIKKSPLVSDTIYNDEYLPFRLYEATDVRKPITKYFIKKNNLEDFGIEVIPNRNIKGTGKADFNYLYGNISFSNDKFIKERSLKSDFVTDAAHEVEHARQHSLIGRLLEEQSFNGSYHQRCFEKKGRIQDKNSFFEAKAYLDDLSLTQHFDFTNPVVFQKYSDIYFNSVLEKGARKAGEIAKEDYIAQGQDFAQEFSHIPPKWML